MKKRNSFLILTLLTFFISAPFLEAAVLQVAPSASTYKEGDTVRVSIIVSSPSQSINAVSATVNFPDTLTLTSLSKAGSILNLWAVEPTFSNIDRTAKFEGVALNGFTGNRGTVLTLVFKAKKTGSGTMSISNASVLANDGEGTNVLTNTQGATISVGAATVTEKAAVTSKETADIPLIKVQEIKKADPRNPQSKFKIILRNQGEEQEYTIKIDDTPVITWTDDGTNVYQTAPLVRGEHAITFTTTDAADNEVSETVVFNTIGVSKPIIEEYVSRTLKDNYVVVKGIADPKTTITVHQVLLPSDEVHVGNNLVKQLTSTLTTNTDGRFVYISPEKASSGAYSVTVRARTTEGFESEPSDAITIEVLDDVAYQNTKLTVDTLLVPFIGAIFLLLITGLYGLYKYRRLKKKIGANLIEEETLVKENFATIDGDLEEYARLLLKVKSRSPLSITERESLVQIKKDIIATQRVLTRKIKQAEKIVSVVPEVKQE
jgi:hypothetical protein